VAQSATDIIDTITSLAKVEASLDEALAHVPAGPAQTALRQHRDAIRRAIYSLVTLLGRVSWDPSVGRPFTTAPKLSKEGSDNLSKAIGGEGISEWLHWILVETGAHIAGEVAGSVIGAAGGVVAAPVVSVLGETKELGGGNEVQVIYPYWARLFATGDKCYIVVWYREKRSDELLWAYVAKVFEVDCPQMLLPN
jgi:hypothetical protein